MKQLLLDIAKKVGLDAMIGFLSCSNLDAMSSNCETDIPLAGLRLISDLTVGGAWCTGLGAKVDIRATVAGAWCTGLLLLLDIANVVT